MRHIIPISGKDSLSAAIVQIRKEPDLPYEFFFNPTGMDLPESLAWIDSVESYLTTIIPGAIIERVGDDLAEIMREQKILPAHKARYCTRLAKIQPMEDWINGDKARVYYGIRADEHRIGYQSLSMKRMNIEAVYPLKEVGMGISDVWELVTSLDLLPPQFFWKAMYQMVISRLGVAHDLINGFKPWERGALFARRTRPNCHNCFYQRLYELVGLLEHHPDLFWYDSSLEQEIGGKDFFFKQGWPLTKIAEHADAIKRKRCITICKQIVKKCSLSLEFDDENDIEDVDLLEVVPCGLFCGK